MNNPRQVSWFKALIVQTIWPLLARLEASLTARIAGLLPAGSSPSAPGGAAGPARVTQQIEFGTNDASAGDYFGADGTGAVLDNARILYRARGGEIIRSFIFSQPVSHDGEEPQVEIVHGTQDRASTSSFTVPITLTLGHSDNHKEVKPAVVLTAGQCIFGLLVVGVAGGGDPLLDCTLEIERDAIVS